MLAKQQFLVFMCMIYNLLGAMDLKVQTPDSDDDQPGQAVCFWSPRTPRTQKNLQLCLIEGVKSNRLDRVEWLLEHRANVNTADRHGRVPVIEAVKSDLGCLVKFLVDRHADISIPDTHARDALAYAVRKDHAGLTRYLISCGAYLDAIDTKGMSALMYAAKHNKYDHVIPLLLAGANTTYTNERGENATRLAGYAINKLLQQPRTERTQGLSKEEKERYGMVLSLRAECLFPTWEDAIVIWKLNKETYQIEKLCGCLACMQEELETVDRQDTSDEASLWRTWLIKCVHECKPYVEELHTIRRAIRSDQPELASDLKTVLASFNKQKRQTHDIRETSSHRYYVN